MEHSGSYGKNAVPETNLVTHILSAFLLTVLIFCTDEGYYDFRWMKEIGNWIIFPMYALPVAAVFIFVHFLLFRRSTGWSALLVSSLFSVLIVIVLMIVFFTE